MAWLKEMGKNRYEAIIEAIFASKHRSGARKVAFERQDFEKFAKKLGVDLPKNVGDVLYSFRHRTALPESITSKAPKGKQWIIRGVGAARYRF